MPMRRILVLPLLTLLAACSDAGGPSGREVKLLLKLGGDLQTAAAGTALPNPLVVGAYDFESRPLAGVEVSFNISSGGGSVSPQLVVTNANGIAQTRWTLGPSAGAQVATAGVQVGNESINAEFTATAN